MHIRHDIVELFSTFVQFESGYFSTWVTDAQLRRTMQRCLNSLPEAPISESFWVVYWYKLWQTSSHPTANLHLAAYLQEPCYWAAQQTVKKFTSPQHTLPDYFQIAIAEMSTVLRRFNPDKGANLKSYAEMAFSSLLRDMLRQRQEIDLCTPWTLLRKVSKKRFVESLQSAGLSASITADYQFAWNCFKNLYVPTTTIGKLSKPDRSLWEAVANLYNTERRKPLPPSSPPCSAETMEQWLTDCATWIKAYLYPSIVSLNALKAGQDGGEEQDDLSVPFSESLLMEMIAQEDMQIRQTMQLQIHAVLIATLEKLAPQSQEIMRLYYEQRWTQQQIGQQLQMGQATVVRRLQKMQELLLIALVQWSQEKVNIPPNPTLIKDMSTALKEWLQVRYPER
ncbi:MAG: sigma-70 family RNA polymerase sigma factor [Cyanobacteria bacterium CRU_2_1]|nr:sigma-70 family RNA polymerase sigma factor [Cyanobacteria bacterium RU_5_0]NJR60363.1 sigma-70 family RNA polymerase sigma factor [Cyanobacteria bacterium CRU_2_1]